MSIFKRIISTVISATLVGSCMISIPAEAKVITPEIVKTETWTTSYYIDNDKETLYPYIQCIADIYNDGSMTVTLNNMVEWDGMLEYETSHTLSINELMPIPMNTEIIDENNKLDTNALTISFSQGNNFVTETYTMFPYDRSNVTKLNNSIQPTYIISPEDADYSFFNTHNINYYASNYSYSTTFADKYKNSGNICCDSTDDRFRIQNNSITYDYCQTTKYSGNTNTSLIYTVGLENLYYCGTLPEFPTTEFITLTFRPNSIIDSDNNFRIFGHDITISPDVLSSAVKPFLNSGDIETANDVAENVDKDSKITALTYDNELLSAQLSGLTEINNNLTSEIGVLRTQIQAQKYEIEDLNAKILMYEDKIAKMSSTAEIVSTMGDDIKRCDINGDSLIDAVDASIILSAYARISTGENIQHISQVVN